MFITILEVLTDRTQTKIIKHTYYLASINANNLSDFQKSERPITTTAKKPNQTLLQLEKKQIKYIFRIPGHQILTEVQQTT